MRSWGGCVADLTHNFHTQPSLTNYAHRGASPLLFTLAASAVVTATYLFASDENGVGGEEASKVLECGDPAPSTATYLFSSQEDGVGHEAANPLECGGAVSERYQLLPPKTSSTTSPQRQAAHVLDRDGDTKSAEPQAAAEDLLGMLQGEDVSRAESGGVSGGEGLLDEGGVGIILAEGGLRTEGGVGIILAEVAASYSPIKTGASSAKQVRVAKMVLGGGAIANFTPKAGAGGEDGAGGRG
ncbi:hypothetical protein T484DRAFT_1782805 [Baffinella frigidus]|nr:hypothetical protein T484DRAFT_1782805 [Cryptophyta sp. CCMP2293]